MTLNNLPFQKINKGRKTIECRLFDNKRKKIKINDTIIFKLKNNDSQKIRTDVVNLYKSQTFDELISKLGADKFGWDKKEDALAELKKFYSNEQEKEFGVLGILISKM